MQIFIGEYRGPCRIWQDLLVCVQPEMRHGASTQHWWVRALTPIQRKEDGRVRGASREPCEYMHENVSSPTPCPSSSSSSSFPFFTIDVAIKRENIFGGFGGLTGGGRIVNLFSRRVDERQGIIDLCCDLEISLLSGREWEWENMCCCGFCKKKVCVGSLRVHWSICIVLIFPKKN